MEDLSRQFR
jgi:hypothetical protein